MCFYERISPYTGFENFRKGGDWGAEWPCLDDFDDNRYFLLFRECDVNDGVIKNARVDFTHTVEQNNA